MRAGQPPDIIVARDEAEQLEAGQGLSNRSGSWIIVPPSWASIAPGCDYCNARNAPRFALLVCLLAAIIFVSRMLTGDRLQQLLAYLDRDPLEGSIYFVVHFETADYDFAFKLNMNRALLPFWRCLVR